MLNCYKKSDEFRNQTQILFPLKIDRFAVVGVEMTEIIFDNNLTNDNNIRMKHNIKVSLLKVMYSTHELVNIQ